MPSKKNKDSVQNLIQKINDSKSILVGEYHGLDANKINDLREMLEKQGSEMSVAKNTLMKVALKESESDTPELHNDLKGPTAVFFAYQDAVGTLKDLIEFAKKNENLPKLKAGIIEGLYAQEEKLKVLSELPSKEELLGRLVGVLNSPVSGIVNVLSGSQRNFVSVLSNIADKKKEEV